MRIMLKQVKILYDNSQIIEFVIRKGFMNSYDLNQIWDLLLDKLAHATGESNMNMYIRQIAPVKLENDVVYCTVPSATLHSSIQQKFYTIIVAALNEITDNSNLSLVLNVENTNRLDNRRSKYE